MLLSLFYAVLLTINLTSVDPGIKLDCLIFEVKEKPNKPQGNKHHEDGWLPTISLPFLGLPVRLIR